MKPSFSLREFLKYVALSIIFGSLYFYFGDLSLQMSKNPGTTSAFFIPSGFAVAMMIIFGARYLPVIFLAKFVLGLSTQKPLIMNLVLCMASISEAYVGFAIYRSFKDSIELNFKYHANLVLIFIVALTAPILSAFIGITYLYFLDIVKESSYFSNIFTWYAGDALSIMIFLPAFLSFREVRHMMFDFLAPIIAILITYCFKWPILWPYIFLIYGAILIPAIFGSIMGVYYSLISMALVMNWFLINHIGPFSLGISNENMTSMQFFLLSISVSALALDGFKRTRLIKSTIIPLMSFWFLSGAIYFYYSTQKEDANKNAMTVLRKDFENRLTEKMEFYENVVNGASAFGLGSYVTQAKWQDYANSISIINKQKGVEAFALIFPDELKIKAHSFVSPTRLNNEGRFEDLINLPELIPSFQKSALLRKPILSSAIKYRLGADSPQQLVSFLIGSIIKNNKVSSWIVIPFLIEDFFKSFVETNYKANFLDIDLYDGLNIQKEKRIYFNVIDDGHRSNESHGTPITRFTLAEHAFTIDWNETQRLITSNSSQNSLFFLLKKNRNQGLKFSNPD